MLIAHATRGGKRLLILGLSRGNIERLLADKPMLLTRETHGEGIPEGWEISILFGETEEAIQAFLAPATGPDTEVIYEPKLTGK